MSLAYFPLYPDDFEADTAHLTLAEDGAYNRLMRLCWRTPGCSVPADKNWIYRRLRAHSDDDRAVIDIVLEEFFTVQDGRYSNARLTKEWLEANEAHERRKKAGAKGGKAKSLKSGDAEAGKATAKPKQPEPEPDNTTQRSSARERLLAVAGPALADPSKEPGLIQTAPEIDRWLQAGCDLEADIVPVIQARTANPRGSPIRSWRFFTDAVLEARDRRNAGLPPTDPTRFENERRERKQGGGVRDIYERRVAERAANG